MVLFWIIVAIVVVIAFAWAVIGFKSGEHRADGE